MNNLISPNEAKRLADMAQPKLREKQVGYCIDLANNSIRSAADSGEYKATILLSAYPELKNVNKYRMAYLAKELEKHLKESGYRTECCKENSRCYIIEAIFWDGEYEDEEVQ